MPVGLSRTDLRTLGLYERFLSQTTRRSLHRYGCFLGPSLLGPKRAFKWSRKHVQLRSRRIPSRGVQLSSQKRTRRMMLGDADQIREASARRSARTGEIEALSVQLAAALALPPASQERQAQIDQTAQSLQNLVDRILDDRAQAMAAHAEAEHELEVVRTEAPPSGMGQDSRLAVARAAFIGAHEERTTSMLNEIDGASANWSLPEHFDALPSPSPLHRFAMRRSRLSAVETETQVHPSRHRVSEQENAQYLASLTR